MGAAFLKVVIFVKRHAYLIIAHQHFDMLQRLIRALDSEHADFYIHIDRRVKDVDEARLLGALKASKGRIFRKYKLSWGADTQVRCEMLLLGQAVRTGYDYYHLLSGVDIPLKRREEIEAFFEDRDESFIEFVKHADTEAPERARYYYPLQNLIGRPKKNAGIRYALLDQLSYELVKIQKLLRMDRTKGAPFAYQRGSQWFSISHELADYVIRNEKTVRRYFYHALASDEMVMQCMAMASPCKDSVVRSNLRLIDWVRTEHDGCSPHTFTMDDWDMLTASDRLFARKFDPAIDAQVIDALYSRLEGADE